MVKLFTKFPLGSTVAQIHNSFPGKFTKQYLQDFFSKNSKYFCMDFRVHLVHILPPAHSSWSDADWKTEYFDKIESGQYFYIPEDSYEILAKLCKLLQNFLTPVAAEYPLFNVVIKDKIELRNFIRIHNSMFYLSWKRKKKDSTMLVMLSPQGRKFVQSISDTKKININDEIEDNNPNNSTITSDNVKPIQDSVNPVFSETPSLPDVSVLQDIPTIIFTKNAAMARITQLLTCPLVAVDFDYVPETNQLSVVHMCPISKGKPKLFTFDVLDKTNEIFDVLAKVTFTFLLTS